MFDDLTVIYLAAVQTTQISVNNLMKYLHMDQYADIKKKLVEEIDQHLAFEVWDIKGNYINHERLREACSYENIFDGFDYTMSCFRESLRIEPPTAFTTSHTVNQDVTLAKGTPKELTIQASMDIRI